MTNKERYSEWVEAQDYVPLFLTPWWMDAVCAGKQWDVLLAEDEQGQILGAMPYLLGKWAWYKYIRMPQYTPIGGIWVTTEVTADKWKTAEVCRQIKEQLDKLGLAYYYQQYLPGSLCVDAMRGLGAASVKTATMLFKPGKLEYDDAKPDYIGHEISEEFVIGYGLDFDGFRRNLDAIYKVKE